jgi:ubiquinone/menaquinone biosynthesis C-methylase UbiE
MSSKLFEEKISKLRRADRIEELEVSRVVRFVQPNKPNEKLLDIGTGSALFAESFCRMGYKVTGVDTDPDMLVAARHYLPQADFLVAAAENLPLTAKSFDMSFMGMVLHETKKPMISLMEAKRVTRQTVTVLEWPPPDINAPPPPAPRISPDEMENMVRTIGFSNLTIHPLNKMIFYLIHI